MEKGLRKYSKDIIIFLIPCVIFLILLLAYYPGIIPYDGNFQWNQVQTEQITSGHPFLSTYFMLLLSKIWNSPTIVLLFQIFIFSLFWTIMCNKTRSDNFKKQIIYTFFISCIPIISIYSITLWKDVLYSYYLMMLAFLTYHYVNDKKYEISILQCSIIGLLLFLIYSYRYNAIIAVGLYVLIISILFLKNNLKNIKKVGLILITFVVLFLAVSIPKNHYLGKTSKFTGTDTSVGEITHYEVWIFGAFLKNDVVSDKDKEFLNNIIEIEKWKDNYSPYLINGTKIPDKNKKFLLKNKNKLQNMFIKYTKKYPFIFIKHYLKADSLLISINSININSADSEGNYVYVYPFRVWDEGNLNFGNSKKSKIKFVEKKYTRIINASLIRPLDHFYQPGLILYISFGCVIYLVIKRKNKNYYLVLLPMILNTVSLLPINLAQDLRYVYINYLTFAVIGLLAISKEKIMKEERNMEKIKISKNPKVLLVIPAYNEEDNILQTYNSIVDYNKKNKTNYDIIVINDGSIDRTSEICRENKIPTINLIHNLGIGGAVQTGYKYAKENDYDIAIQFDGDGQHDVSYVKNIIEPIINNEADFVIGSRFVKNDKDNFKSTLMRRLGIKLISFAIKSATKQKVYDTTSGFRAVNKSIINDFASNYPVEYPEPITTVEILKKGYRLSEISVKMNERKGGKSSIHSWKNAYYMINVLLSIFIIGLRGDK